MSSIIQQIRCSFAWALLGASAVCASACKKDPAPSAASATASSPSVRMPSAAPPGSNAVSSGSRCPSKIPGASTQITDVEGGVELTITSKAEPSVLQIRQRAREFATDSQRPPSAAAQRREKGGMRPDAGISGGCPVVRGGTTISAHDVDKGAKLSVKVNAPEDVEWLRRETRGRLKLLPGH